MSFIEYVTYADLLMGRHKSYPLTEEEATNLGRLWHRVNQLCSKLSAAGFGPTFTVSSGYRPGHYNTKEGGAKSSAHLSCEAVDLVDPNGKLDVWLEAHENLLEGLKLSREHSDNTNGWVHVDIRQRSGRYRTFKP